MGSLVWVFAGSARAEEPLLHEYVANVDAREAALGVAVASSAAAAAGDSGERASDAPAYVSTQGDGSPGEPPGRRSATFRPDRLTELSSGLDYYEIFRPSIAPFKRVSSLGLIRLDADGTTPVIVAQDSRHTIVRVEGEASAAPDARPRDRFSAELTLDFGQGSVVPLPSVSPESRILSLSSMPPVALRVERDLDDNFVARVMGSVPEVPVRVKFVTDAPRSYFGTELPQGKVSGLELEVPALEPSIERRGLAMAKRLGLSRRSELRSAIETLTRYFRAFEESSTPPQNTGDVYLDLVRSQKGICRHRAYGFVVTAQALGIPARFVQNEAHSWVEVKLPRAGFMRIDLGGAANGLTAHNTADGPSYVPSQPDALPQPSTYRRSIARAAARATGVRPDSDSLAGRWVNTDALEPKPSAEAAADARQAVAALAPGASSGAAQDASSPPAVESQNGVAGDVGDLRSGTVGQRQSLAVTLQQRSLQALRGTQLRLAGRIVDAAERGVPGLRVEVWITAPARPQRMLLGVCVTDPKGHFATSLGVPPDLRVGDYKLQVLTPGNAQYAAAMAL